MALIFKTNQIPGKVGGKVRSYDLHDLPIGKTFVHKLPQADLFQELLKLDIPGIASTMGHQDLALIYACYRAEQKEQKEAAA
jgi:hypothetical protein